MMNVEYELTEIIREIKGYEENHEIDLKGKQFFEDFDFNSIDIMELLVRVEEKFSITFDPEELMQVLNDCDQLVLFLERKAEWS